MAVTDCDADADGICDADADARRSVDLLMMIVMATTV